MKLSQYLVKKLTEYGVTDVFGIPGGVILEFIYELDKSESINVHLSYHEQAAAYAACGYAQSLGKLGVAYATKGPGVTNMITAIAEAYCDSLPVLFVTAHSQRNLTPGLRIEEEQEIDHMALAASITKYQKRVDTEEEALEAIVIGCREAMSGRKGPVLLDFADKILKKEVEISNRDTWPDCPGNAEEEVGKCLGDIKNTLGQSKRPILLIGDGVRLSGAEKEIAKTAERFNIPILSSRISQDLLSGCPHYFGYIGSHGLRYSNFILSKTDCIISLGNRLAFRTDSESFNPVTKHAKIIRVDIDGSELNRMIPNSVCFCADIKKISEKLATEELGYEDQGWLDICNVLKEELKSFDINPGVTLLSNLIEMLHQDEAIVCDIGNNELIASRAYAISGNGRKLLHSKAFKTVGSAIGKAIGVYYACKKRVLCIAGDQGFQFNIQELQYISQNQLPIVMVICNNSASGMLKDSEYRQGYKYHLHTTTCSGYGHPNFEKIAKAYGISYMFVRSSEEKAFAFSEDGPLIIELAFGEECEVQQHLPKGNPCQMFVPEINEELYEYLDKL